MAHRDLTGMRFGKLVAIEIDAANTKRLTKWLCKCDCGAVSSAYMTNLVRGSTKSCGCSQTSQFVKHSMYGTKVYHVWGSMIQRCTNPNDLHFDRYGGRGIKVCEAWRDFSEFFKDMGEPNGMTLDRIDNELGYSKENCQWVDRKTQTRNRHNTVLFEVNGEQKTLDELSILSGHPRERIRARIRRGWTIEKSIA